MTFQRYNNIIGILVFAISAIVYILTLEPSVSFWDCGEWISVVHGLQVGHPPGAPLYVLLAKVFSLISCNPANVAYYINMLSAVASALTVMLLFWTSTYFIKLLLSNTSYNIRYSNAITLTSSFAGAMVYAFSDTFWFSAVESEVYALSGFFSALMFWSATKYHRCTQHPYRWIILIFFLVGLSFGVHNLSLLVVPAIAMMYYYRNYQHKHTITRSISALIISAALLAAIYLGIIPCFFYLMGETSVWLVNDLNMSVAGSAFAYLGAVMALLLLGVILTHIRLIKLSLVCTLYLIIGLSLQCVTMFCSMSEPVTNEGQPSNPKALYSYIQRDQYEKAPLIYGAYYTAPFDTYSNGKEKYDIIYTIETDTQIIDTCYSASEAKKYAREDKTLKIKPRYIVSNDGKNSTPVFDKEFYTLFPRMWKHGENYADNYYSWSNGEGKFVEIDGEKVYKPSFSDNISFFFNYQLNYMYIRYLMWNFSGKHEDISKDDYYFLNQDWITGIDIVDQLLGKSTLSSAENKGPRHNTYFMIPFVLGIIGFFFQLYKNTSGNVVLSTLFFFTSIAIVIYLNQAAYEPRERDYVYSTSFYTFAVWISMGIATIFYLIQKIKPLQNKTITSFVCLLTLSLPTLMAYQNWDDHDRSKQYLPRDMAYNFLQSCAPNAILFTNGDNDTFPLWYLQQVEGIRTDVRIINLSLLSSGWYINQIKDQNKTDNMIFMSLNKKDYQGDRLEMAFTQTSDYTTSIDNALEYLKSDSSKINIENMPPFHIIPVDYLYINTTNPKSSEPETTYFELPQMLTRSNIIHLDIISSNYNHRPIYYTDYALSEVDFLKDYYQLEGMTYRLVLHDMAYLAPINTDTFYHNVMNTFKWGNIEDNYVGNTSLEILNLMMTNISKLSNSLLENGDTNKAHTLWNHILNKVPQHMISNTEAIDAVLDINTLEDEKELL